MRFGAEQLRVFRTPILSTVLAACLLCGIGAAAVTVARADNGAGPSLVPTQPAGVSGYDPTGAPCGLGCNPATVTAPTAQDDTAVQGGTVVNEPGENGSFALIIAFLLVGGATVWGLSQLIADRRRDGALGRSEARRRRRALRARGGR